MDKYQVRLNWNHSLFYKISNYFFVIAFIGFIIIYIINLPVKNLPLPIFIAYYDILPRWLTKSFLIPLILLIIAFILRNIKLGSRATLEVKEYSVLIESKMKRIGKIEIPFSHLRRISIVKSPFSLRPFKIEFVHFDYSCKRIIAKNLDQCAKIVEELTSVLPERVKLELMEMQSDKAVNK